MSLERWGGGPLPDLNPIMGGVPPELKNADLHENGAPDKLQTKEDHHPAAFYKPGIMVPFFSSNYAILLSK